MTQWHIRGEVTQAHGRFRWEIEILKKRRFWFSENLGYRSGLAYTVENAKLCISSYVQEVTGQDWWLK
jgi:hypothetical protein